MTQRTPEERVTPTQTERYIAALQFPAKAFEYCHPDTIRDLVSMLRELQSLRRREYICARCGIRKDGEVDGQPDF